MLFKISLMDGEQLITACLITGAYRLLPHALRHPRFCRSHKSLRNGSSKWNSNPFPFINTFSWLLVSLSFKKMDGNYSPVLRSMEDSFLLHDVIFRSSGLWTCRLLSCSAGSDHHLPQGAGGDSVLTFTNKD